MRSPSPLRFPAPQDILSNGQASAIEAGVVHVWPLQLEGTEESLRECAQYLAPAEVARADRFAFPYLRRRFVFAHGLMRVVLARYAGVTPSSLEYIAGASGKPALAAHQPFAATLSFNLTHSGDRALLAVGDGRHVGVDLERTNRKTDTLAIARHYFFGVEFDAIRNAPEAQRRDQFFRYWTAKEAVLKAQGTGLSLALDAFCVRFGADPFVAAVESFDPARLEKDWVVRTLPCEPGWHAAVAAQGPDWRARIEGPHSG